MSNATDTQIILDGNAANVLLELSKSQLKILSCYMRFYKRYYDRYPSIELIAHMANVCTRTVIRANKVFLDKDIFSDITKQHRGNSSYRTNTYMYNELMWRSIDKFCQLGFLSEKGLKKKEISKFKEDYDNLVKNSFSEHRENSAINEKVSQQNQKCHTSKSPEKYYINTGTYRGKPLKKIFYVPKIREENKKGYGFLIGCNVSTYFAAKKSSQYSPKEIHEAVKDAWFYKKFNSINNMEAFLTSRLQNPKKFYSVSKYKR